MTNIEPAAIENAETIIERFGGIRPMATKINVPVTTVQGWKKRNVIPGTRRTEILQAAQRFGVDLTDVLQSTSSAIANENEKSSFSDVLQKTSVPRSAPVVDAATAETFASKAPVSGNDPIDQKIIRAQKRAVAQSTFINIFLIGIVVASVVLLLWPEQDKRIAAIEGDVVTIKEKQDNFLGSIMPDGLEQKFAALQVQADRLQSIVGSAIQTTQGVSNDVLSGNAAGIEQRVAKLESQIGQVVPGGVPSLASLTRKLESLAGSLDGQNILKSSTVELASLIENVPDATNEEQVETKIEEARAESPTLQQTFEGVPQQDLKAAAMLIGMMQFRSSLNRDNQPFEQDYALLKKLAGSEDPALTEALDRLAPYAAQGVLTPEGLTGEFKTIAGDVVVASLNGEDVSIQDKARARLGEIFQVEKNGEPVSGTPAQNTVAKTQTLLEQGDLEAAITEAKTLQGPEAAAIEPWLNKAQATLFAQQLKGVLTQSINLRGFGGSDVTAGKPGVLGIPGTSKVIHDDKSGINILK